MSKHRYRVARFPGADMRQLAFDCKLPAAGYLSLSDELSIALTLTTTEAAAGSVKAIRSEIVWNSRKHSSRETIVDAGLNREKSSCAGQTVTMDLVVDLRQEIASAGDFALEISALVDKRWRHIQTITFIRNVDEVSAVFVVGSPRSGTTIIGNSLRKALGADDSYGESHVLPLLDAVKDTVQQYHKASGASRLPNMMLHHVNPHLLNEQLADVVKKQYQRYFADQWIIDKTPGGAMIWALPAIQRLWPDAKFIFAKRRGLENVVSRMKKFPETAFEAHCVQWRNCMNAWLQVVEQLNHTLEIDQFDILTHPVTSAQRITEFLDLSADQSMALAGFMSEDRPEQTALSQPDAALNLQTIDWSVEQKNTFVSTCEKALSTWGYSLDSSYYRATG